MKTITTVVCVSLLLILLQTLSAQTLTPDQVLKNMEQGNAKYPTLQADIERRAAKPLFNDPGDPYFGKIWIVRTGNGTRRIKIDFSKPQKENILIEKNSFLHYYPVTKQGETKSLSAEGQA